MYPIKKAGMLVCIPLLLTACATDKGDFGLNDIHIKKQEAPKPQFQDEQTPPRTDEQISQFDQPALGVEMEIPLRNAHPKNQQESVSLEPEKITTLTGGNLDIPHEAELTAAANAAGSFLLHTHNGFKESRKRSNMQFVRSGYVMATTVRENNFDESQGPLKFYAGPKGYVYYKGISPAQAFPVSGKAAYTGTWDFVTNAVQGRDRADFTSDNNRGPGDRFGATSADDSVNNDIAAGTLHKGNPVYVGHSNEFEVDFANKTLTGSLYKNHRIVSDKPQERTKRYTVAAKLSGNRFRGSASAEHKEDLYFGKDADLEGGFFGPAAEELAGKFLAKDNSLFGVFAAQRTKTEGETAEKIIDAYRIDGTLAQSAGDNFGDARKLVFQGKVFSLLPAEEMPSENKRFTESLQYGLDGGKTLSVYACCGNLDYLKFGSYWVDKGDAVQFFQGERTPLSQIPDSGNARYHGFWQANIISQSGHIWSESPVGGASGSRAVFDVDFAAKQINGTLTAENRTSPTFSISGQISGNGFSGTARTGGEGFILDPQSTANAVRVHIPDARMNGGFYGPNASELGGVFHSNKAGADKVGGSFGAKKQVSNP